MVSRTFHKHWRPATMHLRALLAKANSVSSVLSERSTQIVTLIRETNALLAQLQTDSAALEQVSSNVSGLARQIDGFIAENRIQLRPMLDKVNGVLAILDNRKAEIQETLKLVEGYSMSLGESVSGGPFFKSYIANILPGQFIQPFVDAAFSDLGLDPSVLLPSQRTDPPVGQPGTPALPVPYPRTGQGGDPNLTLPDAITGKPGDPRYPYREPLPHHRPVAHHLVHPHRRQQGWSQYQHRLPALSMRPLRMSTYRPPTHALEKDDDRAPFRASG